MNILFGTLLKQLRKEKKLTQQQVATALSYGASAICNYEIGKNEPSFTDLVRLADFFEVSTDYMLGRKWKSIEKEDALFLERFNCFYIRLLPNQKKHIKDIYYSYFKSLKPPK